MSSSKPLLINCYDSREQRLLADYAEAHKQSRRFIVVKEGLGRIVEVSPQKGMLFAGRPEEGGWREELATARAIGSLRDAFPLPAGGLKSSLYNCSDSREQRLLADYAEARKQSRRLSS